MITVLQAFLTECLLADLGVVERRLDRAKKEKLDPTEVAAFEILKWTLERELPIRSLCSQQLNRALLRGYGLLSDRPLMVALNRGEQDAGNPLPDSIARTLEEQHAAGMVLSASVEAEIVRPDLVLHRWAG